MPHISVKQSEKTHFHISKFKQGPLTYIYIILTKATQKIEINYIKHLLDAVEIYFR